MNTRLAQLTWIGCVAAACGSPKVDRPRFDRAIAELQRVDSMAEVGSALRDNRLAEMHRRIDANLAAVKNPKYCRPQVAAMADMAPAGAGAEPANAPSGASEYSTTNNQVAGVDEADFVKNDGQYLYLLANGAFQVVAAWPPEKAHVLSRTQIEGEPRKMFVHKGRAIVFSSLIGGTGARGGANQECTYGYSCDFQGDGRPTKITVLDLTTLSNPVVLRETRLSGSLLASRRIGDSIHVAVNFRSPGANRRIPDWPRTKIEPCAAFGVGSAEDEFEKLRKENEKIILAEAYATWLPSAEDVVHSSPPEVAPNAKNFLADESTFYVSRQGEGASTLSIVSFDVDGRGPMRATSVTGKAGVLYASADYLVLAPRHERFFDEDWFFPPFFGAQTATAVHTFRLQGGQPSAHYVGSVAIPGHVLNQFSLDEHQGFLRVATSNGRVPSPDVSSSVAVLKLGEDGPEVVGRVDGIAPGEDIRSVRFEGDRGFVVTFKKTDPLFTLDLSKPEAPRLVGELKIPGFSTYMHMMDDAHLLTIGFEAEDHGSFAYFQGVQLQVFDIGDLANPTLAHKEVIGTRGSTSEAALNHLAFNYFRPKNLLALPMVVCNDSEGGSSFGARKSFSGLMVYEVTAQGGFSYRGGVPHASVGSGTTSWGDCNSWWSTGTTQVKRSVFMDEYVFSIDSQVVRVERLDALGTDLAVVNLTR